MTAVRNAATAALFIGGIGLLGWAAIDFIAYSGFAMSVIWR